MSFKCYLFYFVFILVFSNAVSAQAQTPAPIVSGQDQTQEINLLDELNPFDPSSEQLLKEYDKDYESKTGLPSHLEPDLRHLFSIEPECHRADCPVWVQIVRSQQQLYLHLHGKPEKIWPVSTGVPGLTTPDFDTHPDGRIYDEYTSSRFPGGDYEGLGNMPYAVFIQGGFAIHGTTRGNWPKLGTVASHGCVRLHPDNAFYFNRLVRQLGVQKVWITVQE